MNAHDVARGRGVGRQDPAEPSGEHGPSATRRSRCCFFVAVMFLLLPVSQVLGSGPRVRVDDAVADAVRGGGQVEAMVSLAWPPGLSPQDDTRWRSAVEEDKRRVIACAGLASRDVLHRYLLVPMLHVRVDARTLRRLRRCPGVEAIGRIAAYRPQLVESIPLVRAREAAATWDADGTGVSVAILDTGVEYTRDELGGCLGEGCKVVAGVDVGDNDGDPWDCMGHGTNVSAIAAGPAVIPDGCAPDCSTCEDSGDLYRCTPGGVALGAQLVAVKVFSDTNDCALASTDAVVGGIDWVLNHRVAYNIRVMNLSLGWDPGRYGTTCDDDSQYNNAIKLAWSLGILTVAAAGNDGHPMLVNYPACLSRVMAVANAYDAQLVDEGYVICWGENGCDDPMCVDEAWAADVLNCTSNGGPLIDLAAPGTWIVAGGYGMAGTSQASPFVAGAAAVLLSKYPDASLDDIRYALTVSHSFVEDNRTDPGYVYPRLDVVDALSVLPDVDNDGHVEDDCDTQDGAIYPGAEEVCNGKDDDCDGEVDEGFDQDHDGHTTCRGDCDDTNPLIYPGADTLPGNLGHGCAPVAEAETGDETAPGCSCGIGGPQGAGHHGPAGAWIWLGWLFVVDVVRKARVR